jgi:hypothetical protein
VAAAKQWLGKHAPTATNSHATTEELLEMMFSMQSVSRLYNKDHRKVCWWSAVNNCESTVAAGGCEHRGGGISIDRSCYQAITSDDRTN